MENRYLGKQIKMLFPGDAYQVDLFREGKAVYSELIYTKAKTEHTEKTLPLFKEKSSQLELKLK